MSILSLPPELILLLAENLEHPRDVCALLRTNRTFAFLLQKILRKFAISSEHVEAALYWAALSGNRSMVQLVGEKGPEITVCVNRWFDIEGGMYEWESVTNSIDGNFVEAVLDEGPNLVVIDQVADNSVSALHWAIWNCDELLFRLLLQPGTDLDSQDLCGETPLHLAAQKGAELAVRLLLQQGADSNIQNLSLLSPIHCVPRGNDTVAALLLEEVDMEDSNIFDYVMDLGARRYGPKAIGVLLRRGIGVNFLSSCGIPLLHAAIETGNGAGARLLLENGANPKAQDKHGRTPLEILLAYSDMYGSSRPVIEMGKLLVEEGADVNVKYRDGTGGPILHLAIRSSIVKGEDVVRWLLENKANPSAVDQHGRTALHIVARFVRKDKQELLTATILKYNVNPNVQDEYGRTALHIATKCQMPKAAIKLLLEGGANVNLWDRWRETPLYLAAKHSKAVVGMLLDYGADVEAVGSLGRPTISEGLKKYFSAAPYCSSVNKSFNNALLLPKSFVTRDDTWIKFTFQQFGGTVTAYISWKDMTEASDPDQPLLSKIRGCLKGHGLRNPESYRIVDPEGDFVMTNGSLRCRLIEQLERGNRLEVWSLMSIRKEKSKEKAKPFELARHSIPPVEGEERVADDLRESNNLTEEEREILTNT